jgi:hypothetical protein
MDDIVRYKCDSKYLYSLSLHKRIFVEQTSQHLFLSQRKPFSCTFCAHGTAPQVVHLNQRSAILNLQYVSL